MTVYALDLDEDLLSHMPNPDSWVVINGESISADLIEDEFVREVFVWQRQHLRQHGAPATATVLAAQFDLELVEPETAIGDLLDRLRERYAKNEGRTALREIVELQKVDPTAVPQALLRKGRELNALVTPHGEMFGSGDFDRAKRRYDLKVLQGPGASFGHPELDDYFYGMRGVTFIVAPPKTMKSWQMIQGHIENIQQGRCSWLFCLELPAEESDMRMRCMLADVPWWHYLRNCITTEEWRRIKEASDLIDGLGTYRIHKPPHGHRGIDEMVYKARDAGADVIFIDQLQFIENKDGRSLGSMNATGEYWGVVDRVRELSDSGPICIAHQFNRNTQFSDSMPPIEMAKGSSAIEEFATTAIGMYANRDMRKSNLVEIGTLIARNHQYASWEMSVNLSQGCSFNILGRKDEDEVS